MLTLEESHSLSCHKGAGSMPTLVTSLPTSLSFWDHSLVDTKLGWLWVGRWQWSLHMIVQIWAGREAVYLLDDCVYPWHSVIYSLPWKILSFTITLTLRNRMDTAFPWWCLSTPTKSGFICLCTHSCHQEHWIQNPSKSWVIKKKITIEHKSPSKSFSILLVSLFQLNLDQS